MRISVSCSRAALVSFRASSSSRSVVHRPSFGSGWTSRSYARDVSPDRSILRTVFRDTRRSRASCLIVLPLTKCSRRIRPIVSTVSIPPPPASNQSEQRIRPNWRGSILDADNPLQGVKIARRITRNVGFDELGLARVQVLDWRDDVVGHASEITTARGMATIYHNQDSNVYLSFRITREIQLKLGTSMSPPILNYCS